MAVITFTQADVLLTVTVPAAVYDAEVVKLEGPKPSSSGKSLSYFVTFQIINDDKFGGKELQIAVNSETKTASLLGTMQFFPNATFLEMDAAMNNTEATPKNLDTDELLHGKLAIIVGVVPESTGGKLINVINGFKPLGSGKNAMNW